ncbi:cytochrome-c peroxidase [Flaviaesturariibacter terrae]
MKKLFLFSSLVALVTLLVCCSKNSTPAVRFEALPLAAPAPANNPQSPAKIALGRLLFWDPVLSANGDVACATCHHPALGYADGLDLSIGVGGEGQGANRHFPVANGFPFAKRNALTILNTAFNGLTEEGASDPALAVMFFDNRVRSLEAQSLEPIRSLEEMRGSQVAEAVALDSALARVQRIPEYATRFRDVFGSQQVSAQTLSQALAAFERTLLANHSPYDDYIRGNTGALSAAQLAGMDAFARSGCANCHSGPMFSDYALHVLSVPDNPKHGTDAGAGGGYAFRTASLRNLALTAPYMHSGVFPNLASVLDFYEEVGDRRSQNAHVSAGSLDGKLRRLSGRDKAAIIDFLAALNDNSFDHSIPASVPSGLRPGGHL